MYGLILCTIVFAMNSEIMYFHVSSFFHCKQRRNQWRKISRLRSFWQGINNNLHILGPILQCHKLFLSRQIRWYPGFTVRLSLTTNKVFKTIMWFFNDTHVFHPLYSMLHTVNLGLHDCVGSVDLITNVFDFQIMFLCTGKKVLTHYTQKYQLFYSLHTFW